jgi:hypothetical protein
VASSSSTPPKVRILDIEGQTVRCVETDDGNANLASECADLQKHATRHPEGFCAHTAVAIWRSIDDGSIRVT